MAIDEASLPMVMSATIPRTNADGTPTKWMIDWEEQTRNWYKNNAVALDSRITEVKATADNASAAVTVETNARITEDGALAEQITTVSATFNSFSANGEIYFAASATPTGAVAAYGIYLTAGNAYSGLEIIANSDGTSSIGLTAAQLFFVDSGTKQAVFTYSGGQFWFTGNVAIDGNLLVGGTIATGKVADGAITTDKVLDNAISHGATGSGTWTGASCVIAARQDDLIFVTVSVQPTASVPGGATPGSDSASITINGGSAQTLRIVKTFVYTGMSAGIATGDYYWAPSCRQFVFTAASTGNHTIACGSIGAAGETEILITALAISK